MKNYESLSDALHDLNERGYKANFESQTFCLYCGDLDLRLDPEDFHVDEIYHFGNSAVEKVPAVYAISSVSGVKGVLVDINGVSARGAGFEPEEVSDTKKTDDNPVAGKSNHTVTKNGQYGL